MSAPTTKIGPLNGKPPFYMLTSSDLCDQTFTQYSSLQKHARVHDKKKPYRCEHEGCDQAFSQVILPTRKKLLLKLEYLDK
jgi:uncharacterized Zn-finger protein